MFVSNENVTNLKRKSPSPVLTKNTEGSSQEGPLTVQAPTENMVPKISEQILWTSKVIASLDSIMTSINKTILMRSMGYIVRYYINKYRSNDIDHRIVTMDQVIIKKDVLILAYICEIYIASNDIKSDGARINIMVSNKLTYEIIGKIIREVIDDIFVYQEWIINFNEGYMVNLVSDILVGTTDNKEIKSIITSAYYFTSYFIDLCRQTNDAILLASNSILVLADGIDISFISRADLREIMSVLGTKRKIYIRIFLLIADHMIRERSGVNKKWIHMRTHLRKERHFDRMMSDTVMELILTLTAKKIKDRIDNPIPNKSEVSRTLTVGAEF